MRITVCMSCYDGISVDYYAFFEISAFRIRGCKIIFSSFKCCSGERVASSAQAKKRAWVQVADSVNRVSPCTRTVGDIKRKKEVLFSSTKVKVWDQIKLVLTLLLLKIQNSR